MDVATTSALASTHSLDEAAEILGIDLPELARLIAAGVIRTISPGANRFRLKSQRVTTAELDRFVHARLD